MTPNAALTAVIARLTAAGLVQARSPLGVQQASSQRMNRSFSVIPVGIGPSGSPGRGAPRTSGLRMAQAFEVKLGHQVKPGDGQEAPSQALQDYHTVLKYLSARDTTLTTTGAIIFSSATHRYEGGGAFMTTTFTLNVTYELSLVI
jgi:hypothetical protein